MDRFRAHCPKWNFAYDVRRSLEEIYQANSSGDETVSECRRMMACESYKPAVVAVMCGA